MNLAAPDSASPTGTATSHAAPPSPGNSEIPAPGVNTSVYVRVAFKALLWGPCKLHIFEAPPTTTISDIISLAAQHRHGHLLPILQLLLAIFVHTTIEETRFSQVTATDTLTTEPIEIVTFDAKFHDELTQAYRRPEFFRHILADRYPDLLTSSPSPAKAMLVKPAERSLVAIMIWLIVTAFSLAQIGGSTAAFQTIVAANIIACWVHVWFKLWW
ncbi:hypothetical protein B0T18DRAFT_421261 [Schizothecium vesticola]|uniref:Uncharacterized protein n=1 Tax=Schizothecium vesticola TaxID=314040 RepID=A0AA40EFM5_9PEZI|nr:hypothetical protein B0T18DRAFT_421261 [Schizothecium vesticola]